jgi:hypothetical protein
LTRFLERLIRIVIGMVNRAVIRILVVSKIVDRIRIRAVMRRATSMVIKIWTVG